MSMKSVYGDTGEFLSLVDTLLLDQDNERLKEAVENLAMAPPIRNDCCRDPKIQIGGWVVIDQHGDLYPHYEQHGPEFYTSVDIAHGETSRRVLDCGAVLYFAGHDDVSEHCSCYVDRDYDADGCWSCNERSGDWDEFVGLCSPCYERIKKEKQCQKQKN